MHINVSEVDVHWGWAGALRVPLSDLLSYDASWSSMGRSRVWEALNYYFWGVFLRKTFTFLWRDLRK